VISINLFTKVFYNNVIILPTPLNISFLWNFGFLLGICIINQLIRGVLLACTYSVSDNVFRSLFLFIENYSFGWFIRYIHFNGASLFFLLLYIHMGRSLYYNSYKNKITWLIGVLILILIIAIAFLGYVLPINQISYWGASVITNLFREVPVFGVDIVNIIWGSRRVRTITVSRFFCLHFIIPFLVLGLIILHVVFLHSMGSNNPLGCRSKSSKLIFNLYSSKKDMFIFSFVIRVFYIFIIYYPLIFGDNENFVESNFSVTPHHIQPEWYFLFAYAILRSVPNKLGGVVILAISILVFFFLPYIISDKVISSSLSFIKKACYWSFIITVILLTWIGSCPVEYPFLQLGQIFSVFYFIYFIILYL